MSIEIIIAGSSLVTAVFAAGGIVATWRKNGRVQAARDQEIKDNQKAIIDRLDNKETGLTALNEKFHSFEVNCAGTRSAFDQRLIAAERDIKDVKKKAP